MGACAANVLTGRQVAFVRHVLAGLTSKAAAVSAGYSPASAAHTGARLRRNPTVANAIEAGKATRSAALDQVEEIRRLAVERGDPGAAIRAVELKTRMLGLVA